MSCLHVEGQPACQTVFFVHNQSALSHPGIPTSCSDHFTFVSLTHLTTFSSCTYNTCKQIHAGPLTRPKRGRKRRRHAEQHTPAPRRSSLSGCARKKSGGSFSRATISLCIRLIAMGLGRSLRNPSFIPYWSTPPRSRSRRDAGCRHPEAAVIRQREKIAIITHTRRSPRCVSGPHSCVPMLAAVFSPPKK